MVGQDPSAWSQNDHTTMLGMIGAPEHTHVATLSNTWSF